MNKIFYLNPQQWEDLLSQKNFMAPVCKDSLFKLWKDR